ncbi:MAG TPA: hypothetical protein VMT56_02915 [Candidatus Bathyarchaeia archaeon]|nr:hypothetical protein [Candidatus Bathyarchaeia archaeon]
MLTGQEVKRISKPSFDALCPYCKSRAVYLVSAHRGAVDDQSSPAFGKGPGAYIEDWCCAICFRSFELY